MECVGDNKQYSAAVSPDGYLSLLSLAVFIIKHRDHIRITEDCRRTLKAYFMFADILFCFQGIPFKMIMQSFLLLTQANYKDRIAAQMGKHGGLRRELSRTLTPTFYGYGSIRYSVGATPCGCPLCACPNFCPSHLQGLCLSSDYGFDPEIPA